MKENIIGQLVRAGSWLGWVEKYDKYEGYYINWFFDGKNMLSSSVDNGNNTWYRTDSTEQWRDNYLYYKDPIIKHDPE